MIKKKYFLVLSVAAVTVLLGSLFYGSITQAQKGKEAAEVYLTNLPIDEQGNLRTTIVQSSKIVLVFNQSLSVPSDNQNFIYLTSVSTSGFKYACVMAQAQGTWQVGAYINIWSFENNFGVRTIPRPASGYFSLETSPAAYRPSWGAGTSGEFKLHSTEIDLYLQVHASDVGFDGLLAIVVYLTT